MWIPKPEKEYRREALKKGFAYLVKPWWITVLVIICSLMAVQLYFGTGGELGEPRARTRAVLTAVCLALLGHMGLAEIFRSRGQKNNPERVICERCHDVKNDDGSLKCACGGRYIDINRLKWVDEEDKT